jgi:SAM-dependent methyltransferase
VGSVAPAGHDKGGDADRSVSVGYDHLLAIICTQAAMSTGTMRLLDAGCGEGKLLTYLTARLGQLRPDLRVECYGFDVDDSGMRGEGLEERLIRGLGQTHPEVDWGGRVTVIHSSDAWPYPDDFFDVIVSNQVLEHVWDHELFFSETYRTLKDGGYAAHLAPLRHCLYEPHIRLPLFHRLNNHDLRVSYVRAMTLLGFKKQFERLPDTHTGIDEFSAREADVMREFTNYLSGAQLYRLGKRHHLRTSFRYTHEYYRAKFRKMLGLPPVRSYRWDGGVLLEWLATSLLKYVASVTVFLEKKAVISAPPHS